MNPKTTLWLRGIAKMVTLALLANQVLTLIFSIGAHQVDPDVDAHIITLFSVVTSLLAGVWLQADARRAYLHAKAQNLIRASQDTSTPWPWALDPACPRKWLVTLHLELNPALSAESGER
jgi:hypothetical protein